MNLRENDSSYDAAYAIEATCHASDKTKVFSEVHRVLKPGAFFVGYEWCTTNKYDPEDSQHQEIIKSIEAGNGLPELVPVGNVKQAMEKAGFSDIECWDMAQDEKFDIPWHMALSGKELTLKSLPRTSPGRLITHSLVSLMERMNIAPQGAIQVSSFLNEGADALLKGGEKEIFSPLIFFCGRK